MGGDGKMTEIDYSKYRWYVLATLIVATLAQGMSLIAPTPLVGDIAASLGVELGAATAASLLTFSLLVAIAGVVSGMIIDRWGLAKTFTVFCALTTVASFLLPVFGKSIAGLIIIRGIQGIGGGPVIASGPRLAAEWFPPSQRSMVQGVVGASLSLGIIFGLAAGPPIAANGGWITALTVLGGTMIVALVMSIIFIYAPKSPGAVCDPATGPQAVADFKKVFKLFPFWMTLVSCFGLCWVMQGYNDLTPGHIAVPPPAGLGMGPVAAGQLMSILMGAFIIGSLASPLVAEKIFRGNYRWAISATFILTGIFCASVMLPGVTSNRLVMAVCLFFAGFFMGMPNPMNMSFIANNYPEHITGSVGGFTMGIGIFGGTAGIAAGSAALQITDMYDVSIIIVATVAIVGAVAGSLMRSPKIYTDTVDTCWGTPVMNRGV
jgi:MFS family permease